MSQVLPPTPTADARDACECCGHRKSDHLATSPVYLLYHAGTTYVVRSPKTEDVERDVRSLYGRWGREGIDRTLVIIIEVPDRRINNRAVHADHWSRWIDDGRRTAEELGSDPGIRITEQVIRGRPVYGTEAAG